MKLITERGQLDLPSGFSFTIEQNSPAFSNEGTQSIPATLPTSIRNIDTLGNPIRLGRVDKYIRKIPAKIEAGLFQKNGQLVIDSAQKGSGIMGAVMLNESDFYSRVKDVKLVEIFEKIIRDDFASQEDPVKAWYNHIFSCMTGVVTDDFTAFPIAVNYNSSSGYQLLNSPDKSSPGEIWSLRHEVRKVTTGNVTINVPTGYGVTPFLWLWRALELMFAEWGYTIRENPFKSTPLLSKIVILNNTADTICFGKIKYSDLVPSCTVSEFLSFLGSKFLTHAYIFPESKMVDLVPLQSVLTAAPDLDLTNYVNGEIKQIFSDPQETSISSDISLEGAAPASETIFELNKKHSILTRLDESNFRNNAWRYSFVQRKATGEFYEILQKVADSSVKENRLGSNYFTHYSGALPAREYKSADILPPMVEVDMGLIGFQMVKFICPFVGESRHINTSFFDTKEQTEQKIIIAYAAGRAEEDANILCKAFFGTTQKFNNLGHQWAEYDLTSYDIYKLFFKSWNSVLRNSTRELECRVDYPEKQLLSLRLDRLKLVQGQKLLPKALSYTIGQKVAHNNSQFVVIKPLSPIEEDVEPVFLEQLYRWQYENNSFAVFTEFDIQEWENYTWVYKNADGSTSNNNTFESIPPPTSIQFTTGGQYFYQENEIIISAKRTNESTVIDFDRVLISWFTPVLI